MDQWYCSIDGTRYGPVPRETLREWIASGRLRPTDLVWTEGMDEWQPAAAVGELTGGAPFPPPSPLPAAPGTAALPPAPGAVASMVCGIIGVVIPCAGLILGIVALFQRKKALEAIRRAPSRWGGSGFCIAGQVLGIIAIILGSFWAIYILVFSLLFSVAGAASMH